jgi:Protein of unknown function (DUF3618)
MIPEDGQELRQDIERTREQLGDTVDQLAAKTDVKARARAKAAELAGQVKGTTSQARAKVTDRSAGVRSQVAGKAAVTGQKVAAARDQLQARVAPVWEAAPDPLQRTLSKGAATVRQRRVPLAAAAASLVAGYLAFRWWRGR